MIKPISALIFDLSGVFFNDGLKAAVGNISQKYKLNPKDVEFVLNGSFAEEYRTGLIPPEDFWNNAKGFLGVEDIEDVRRIFFESYHPHSETERLIRKLKRNKVKVGYLSNSPKDRAEFLDKKFNFISLFDFGIFSYQAHAWKPDKKIYKKLMKSFNLKAGEIAYIDDRERDIKPAKELGMKTILFKDVKQLKKELKEAGIKI